MAGVYDLCIVGAGLVGSAAARHATIPGKPHLSVCLVGPKEPKHRDISCSRDVFGGHYDEGRITRELDPDVTWSSLAIRSIRRYREIEAASGVSFYTEVGFLGVSSKEDNYFDQLDKVKKVNNVESAENLTNEDIVSRFPYFNFGSTDIGYFSPKNAGYISPRNMVIAQQKVAQKQGCDVMDDIVRLITEKHEGDTKTLHLETDSGKTIIAKKVLLATNGYTNLCNLIPNSHEPDIQVKPTCVALVEISSENAYKLRLTMQFDRHGLVRAYIGLSLNNQVKVRIVKPNAEAISTPVRSMPSVIYRGKGATDWAETPNPVGPNNATQFYLLPPIKYPDGKFYLKMGVSYRAKVPMDSRRDVKQWFCEQPPAGVTEQTAALILSVVKGVEPLSVSGDSCAVAETPSDRPYIDMVSPNMAVAVGGCGRAAKSSDEIGRLGAELITNGKLVIDYSPDLFKLKFK